MLTALLLTLVACSPAPSLGDRVGGSWTDVGFRAGRGATDVPAARSIRDVESGVGATASQGPPRDASAAHRPGPAEPEGLWPSSKLTELMLMRWADQIAQEYGMEEAQQARVRRAIVKRWGPFLAENRAAIQPLLNEFLEMRLALEPPSKPRVQSWAGRALPVLDRFREQMDKGIGDLREILNPLQRAKLEIQAFEFGVGLQGAEQRLRRLQKGDFDPNELGEFWQPTARRHRTHQPEQQGSAPQPKQAATTNPVPTEETDPILLELKEWDQFVGRFVRVYHLDEGQRGAAYSCLSELKQRALAHRRRRREAIARLEHRIATFSGSEKELNVLKRQLTELYGPIDDMFQELKTRIEQIPTAEQRAAVAP